MKDFSRVFFLLLFCILTGPSIKAQCVEDVDSLGDVWAVTVDQSFSMMRQKVENGYINRDMNAVANDVARRIRISNYFKNVNWKKDRFIFFTSGISDSKSLKRIRNLDTSFIHFSDYTFYQFNDERHFSNFLQDFISKQNYRLYYCSFVSQMRVMSLKKVMEYSKTVISDSSYRNFIIMTISDDAVDQSDQWKIDYRTLKDASPQKVDYVNRVTSRLIYHPINGVGGGELTLRYSDENRIPHIWVYDYQTSQGKRVLDKSSDLFSVAALNGRDISVSLSSDDSIVLCRMDSVVVNGQTFSIGQYFNKEWKDTFNYSKSFPMNDVSLYGKVQIAYFDSILGNHYRVVDFVHTDKVLTSAAKKTISAFWILLIVAAVLFVLYVLLLLPRRVLFTVYDTLSKKKTVVKRGFSWQWHDTLSSPVISFISTPTTLKAIIRHDRKIKIFAAKIKSNVETPQLLLVSKKPLWLSKKVKTNNSSKEDVALIHQDEVGFKSSLLGSVYCCTTESKLYDASRTSNGVVRFFANIVLKIIHLVKGVDYYYDVDFEVLRDDSKEFPVFLSAQSPLLRKKLFTMEWCTLKDEDEYKVQGDEIMAQMALLYYFKIGNEKYASSKNLMADGIKHSDSIKIKSHRLPVLLCCSVFDGYRIWDVFRLNQYDGKTSSLRNVDWVYHYKIRRSDLGAKKKERQLLVRYLKKMYGASVELMDVVFNENFRELRKEKIYARFNILNRPIKQIVSLVSNMKDSRVTQIYNPFENNQSYPIYRGGKSAECVVSFLPIKKFALQITEPYCVRLCDRRFEMDDGTPVRFTVESDSTVRVDSWTVDVSSNPMMVSKK